MTTTLDNEKLRRRIALGAVWVGWTGALALTVGLNAGGGVGGAGLIFIFVGVAIAGTLARTRARLADTITAVFEAGLQTSLIMQANVIRRTCVVEVSPKGIIVSAENADVIGWPNGDLVGRRVEDAVPDRYLRSYRAGFEKLAKARSGRVGTSLVVPVLGAAGGETLMRLSVARLGGSFIGTLAPVAEGSAPIEPTPDGTMAAPHRSGP